MLTISKSTSSLNEGASLTLIADFTNISSHNAGDTVYWDVQGNVSSNDFESFSLYRSSVIDQDGKARITFSARNDTLTEGPESFSVGVGPYSGSYTNTDIWNAVTDISILDTSESASTPNTSIINNNGGVIVSGDNNGTITITASGSVRGTSANDFLEGNSSIPENDIFRGGGGDDRLLGYFGADKLFGESGDDFLHGMHGKDEITGGTGNDTIRGGHGHDEIFGGTGSDWIWGGIGRNTVDAGAGDSLTDSVYVPVDSVQNYDNGNPNGANADFLENLGIEDRIFMHGDGLTKASLTFSSTILDGNQGIGIYANGTLEALVTGNFTSGQVDAMTTGGFFA